MDKKLLEKYNKKWKKATLMDDLKFREVAKSKEAVEEILRVILKDNKLKVLETIEQRNRKEAFFHGVILDCECKLKDKTIVNIEVQVAYNDNPMYRMRYNQSVLTIENSPNRKDFKYKSIPKIISIMFCEFDIFKQKKPLYEIYRKVNKTNVIADNGIREIYVNLKANTKDNKLKNLFKIFTTIDYKNEKAFPKLSKKKEEVIELNIGGKSMSGLTLEIYRDAKKEGISEGIEQGIEQGIAKGREAGRTELLEKLVKEGIITREEADRQLTLA